MALNHPSQRIAHAGYAKFLDPEPTIMHTLEGYSALCPICPWTSGMREFRTTVKLLYDKHLEYARDLPTK